MNHEASDAPAYERSEGYATGGLVNSDYLPPVKAGISVLEVREDGTYYQYVFPSDAKLLYRKHSVETDADGHRHVVGTHDAIIVEWPIDQGHEIFTNDPIYTEETS